MERLAGQATSAVERGIDTVQARASETAGNVASGAGSAAWWTLLTLALAAGGAMAGGAMTARS